MAVDQGGIVDDVHALGLARDIGECGVELIDAWPWPSANLASAMPSLRHAGRAKLWTKGGAELRAEGADQAVEFGPELFHRRCDAT